MSISLNNHESRIIALENKASGSVKSELLLESTKAGNLTLSKSLSLFDMVTVWICLNSNCYGINCMTCDEFRASSAYMIEAGGTSTVTRYKYVSDSVIYHSSNGWRIKVYGLKIYYIFRYNIYKILKLISPILKIW